MTVPQPRRPPGTDGPYRSDLCPACRVGGDPQTGYWRSLHKVCDPVTYWCTCPCDTGELDHRGGPDG